MSAANLLVPAAQYLRMSTEHQQYSLEKPVHRDTEVCRFSWFPSCPHLFRRREKRQNQELHFSRNDTWGRMLQQGLQFLIRFCQEDRIRIRQPLRNLQVKVLKPVSGTNDFVASFWHRFRIVRPAAALPGAEHEVVESK